MEFLASPQTRRLAIQAIERHIIDVGAGRVRLGLKPHEVDAYITDEHKRLQAVRAKGLRL